MTDQKDYGDRLVEQVRRMPRVSIAEALALAEPRLIVTVDPDGHLGGVQRGRLVSHFIGPINRIFNEVVFWPEAYIESDGKAVGFVLSFKHDEGEDIRDLIQHPRVVAELFQNGVVEIEAVGLQPYRPSPWKLPNFKFGSSTPV